MTQPGPLGLTTQTGQRTADPSDLRLGTVAAVTSRGIDVQVTGGLVASAAHIDGYNPAIGDSVAMIRYSDAWLVLGRPVGPATAIDNATRGTGLGLTLLNGMVLSGGGATMASSTGAVVTVPRYNLSYHHPVGHWVMLWAGYSWYNSVTNDVMFVVFKNSVTNNSVGTDELIQAGGNTFGHWASAGYLVSPAEGGKEVKIFMTIQRGAGAGTVRIDDAAARRGYLLAIDMGDQSTIATV